MAVLISSIVKGQTEEGYNSVLTAVHEELKNAPGFLFHCVYPDPSAGGWVVTEVWQSKREADQWFAKFVVPNLPEGIHPKRNYHQELHAAVLVNMDKPIMQS